MAAVPNTTVYRLRKWTRRHMELTGVIAVSVLLLVLAVWKNYRTGVERGAAFNLAEGETLRAQDAERQVRAELEKRKRRGVLDEELLVMAFQTPAKALEGCDKILKRDPEILPALTLKSRSLVVLGRPEEALETIGKAVLLSPDSYVAINARGEQLRALGRLEEALRDFDRAVSLKPEDSAAYYNRAHCSAR